MRSLFWVRMAGAVGSVAIGARVEKCVWTLLFRRVIVMARTLGGEEICTNGTE